MKSRYFTMAAPGLALASLFTQAPGPPPFHHGIMMGDNVLDVKVVDARRRDDGRWLTFGSRMSSGDSGRETAFVVLREANGTQIRAIELLMGGDMSYRPLSLVPLSTTGDIVVLGLEYDLLANRRLSLTRLNADLGIVWSVRLQASAGTFEWARLEDRGPSAPLLLMGEVRREVAGVLDSGDGLLAAVHPDDGSVSDVRTLGTPSDHERIVDARPFGNDGSTLLLVETAGQTGPTTGSGDGLVVLDAAGAVTDTRLIGHAVAPGVRAHGLHLLPHDDGGWVIAGRRVAFGPNVFYLHKLGVDLMPEPSRILIPFFNVIDVDTRDGLFWLYGEANGEVFDTGTVLMGFDATLQMILQRRYATENHVFPTGAFEFSPSGALLALGARRSGDDVFVYEAVHHVALPSGEGVLCDEGDYAGFSTVADATTMLTGWAPSITALDLTAITVTATARPLASADVEVCVIER